MEEINGSTPMEQKPKPKKKKGLMVLVIILTIVVLGVLGEVAYLTYSKAQKTKKIKAFVQTESRELKNVVAKVNELGTEELLDDPSSGDSFDDMISEAEEENKMIEEALTSLNDAKKTTMTVDDEKVEELKKKTDEYYNELETTLKKYKEISDFNLQGLKIMKPMTDDMMVLMNLYQKFDTNAEITDAEIESAFNNAKESFNKVAQEVENMEVPENMKEKYEYDLEQMKTVAEFANQMADNFNEGKYEDSGVAFGYLVLYIQEMANDPESDDLKEAAYEPILEEFENLNKKTEEIKNDFDMLNQQVEGMMEEIEIEDWT
ncbi:MAG: hypothetical protein GF335_01965 [Candidatus Moranbacteria bacterium]|nr:hypothetical protein [Candidatus Moranbacteria bacterium]